MSTTARTTITRRALIGSALVGAGALLGAAIQRELRPAPPITRPILRTNEHRFVRADGDDANDGRTDSPSGALRTWQRGLDLAAGADLNNKVFSLLHGAEPGPVTFTEPNEIPTMAGGGVLRIIGRPTPGGTVFSTTTGDPFVLNNTLTPVQFGDLTLTASAGTGLIFVTNLSRAIIMDGVIFGSAPHGHLTVHDGQGMAYLLRPYTIAGSAAYHLLAVAGGTIWLEHTTVTLDADPHFRGAFAAAIDGGVVRSTGVTFAGRATGKRYSATSNGIVNSTGLGEEYLPGSASGYTADGGRYL